MNKQQLKKFTNYGGVFLALFLIVGSVFYFDMEAASTEKDIPEPVNVSSSIKPDVTLIPGGHSVGVKMDVKGVLVTGLEEIRTEDGSTVNPGLLAGLQIGDSILEIDGKAVDSAKEVKEVLNDLQKEDVRLKVQRKDESLSLDVSPVVDRSDNLYKLGVWVRDKTAGLGTLTFYNPSDETFGALGHAITDPETGSVLKVADGELLQSKVESVKQGRAGDPGEIRGIFYEADDPLGELVKNTVYGIFGATYENIDNELYPEGLSVGYQDEVEEGPAYILTTLDGDSIASYEITIEKITRQSKPDTKSMIIKVTDEELLSESGGIVQGMSGSPIIQNGKIIGAVTHVFVNNPQKGYGIFIEWMLQECQLQ